MRCTMQNKVTLLGLLASGALLAGCSHDADRDGGRASRPARSEMTLPASLERPETPSLPVVPVPPLLPVIPEPTPGPVDPATATAAWKEGVVFFDKGDYASAADKLKTATAGQPGGAYRHYLLGLALWKSGAAGDAQVALVESTKLDPTRLKTWINLARVRHDLNDRSGALEAAEQALVLDPSSADALHQKGRALMELGRRDEALEVLKAGHHSDPANGYIANTLGLLLIQLGRPGEAVEPLETAKAVLPHTAYVRNNLGVAYERTGRRDEAQAEYAAAVDAGDTGGKAGKSLARLGVTGTTGTTDPTVTVASAEAK